MIRQMAGIVAAALALTACSGDYSGGPVEADDGGGNGGNGAGDGGSARFASVEDFFAAEVQPGLAFCRSCHVPEGVAGSDPDAARFMLSRDPEEDYQRLQAA